ncbi:hypothetical protein [Burkholderia glumae]|uniref:hypothetical protein n=1 Tax=Burkholderia glumae TaxID=337 RepID=UPI002036713E|nr:hypothetical protein [Burkholderia glumae]MCM2493274.1 hypothetical protein [Burkholderia glumae]
MSESKQQWTPGPWETNQCGDLIGGNGEKVVFAGDGFAIACGRRNEEWSANGRVAKAAPELAEMAIKARAALSAYLDDHPHVSPHDCYATGPKTGDQYHDLVRCPGCCAQEAFTGLIAGIDAALAKAGA